MPLAPGLLVIAAGDRRSRPVWHRRCLLVALLALVLLALPLTTVLRAGAVAAGAPGGAAINCTNTDSVLGPLQSSVTLAAGTTGSLQLGSPSAGKGHYVGACTLTGTVPAGWTVNEGDWVALTATTGSANAGTFVLSTSNSTFVDSGTFTNAGRFEDDSDGLTQTIAVGDFVNTGTVVSEDGGFGTSGTTANPPCPSCTFVDRGTLRVDPKQAFVSGSIFVLASGGTIDADGNFDIANESTFYVDGGSVTGGVPTTGQYLGQGAATIKFGAQLPASSRGTIDVATDANLQGTIAKHWTVDDTGGSVAATDAGNAGTFAWEGPDNSTFSDATTFVNSGRFTDTAAGWVQYLEVSRFINTGTVTSNAPGFGMAGSTGAPRPVFVDQGRLDVAPKQGFSASGIFDLDTGGTIDNGGDFSIDGTTLNVQGGSVLGQPPSVLYHLGAQPATVRFEPPGPAGSTGTIDVGMPVTLYGVVPEHWTLDIVGGPGPALTASHSGNNGTLIWGSSAPLAVTGTFVNAGQVDVTGGSLQMTAPDFVNAPHGRVVVSSDGGLSDSGDLSNQGSVEIGPGNRFSVLGNYSQSAGGDLAVAAAGSFAVGYLSVGRTASLGGTLTIEKMPGLKVQKGSTAPLVTAHTIAGRFRPVRGVDGPGPALAVVYAPGTVTLEPPLR